MHHLLNGHAAAQSSGEHVKTFVDTRIDTANNL
jgi:hypothetical protein